MGHLMSGIQVVSFSFSFLFLQIQALHAKIEACLPLHDDIKGLSILGKRQSFLITCHLIRSHKG